MTDITEHFMAENRQPLHRRLPAFLSGRVTSPKDLARSIDVDPRTARNILEGHWPSREAWRGLVRAWGYDVLEAVFAPDIDHAAARQTAELKRQEELLEHREARRRALARAANHLSAGADR